MSQVKKETKRESAGLVWNLSSQGWTAGIRKLEASWEEVRVHVGSCHRFNLGKSLGRFLCPFLFLTVRTEDPSIIFLRNVQKENGNRPADLEELKRLSKCQAVSCCTVDRLGMQLRRGLWFDFLAAFLRCFRRVFAELAGFRIYRFLFEFLVVSVIRDNTINYRGHMPKISSVEEMS